MQDKSVNNFLTTRDSDGVLWLSFSDLEWVLDVSFGDLGNLDLSFETLVFATRILQNETVFIRMRLEAFQSLHCRLDCLNAFLSCFFFKYSIIISFKLAEIVSFR